MVPNLLKPSQLGEIPKDWKRVKLSDVMKVRQGLQIAISERLISPTSTSKEYITIQSIKKTDQVREYVEAPSQRVICSKDDVLMTRTGNTGIVVTGVEGAFHNNFFLMDFDKNRIDTTFLVNYLRSPRIQHLILTKAGASTIPDLNHKDFYSIEFPLAPILEQQKIAKILSTWDRAISTTERLIDNSTQQKKALMQQLLTGKKRLLDESGKRFEGEWEEVTLGECINHTGGTALEKHVKDGASHHFISIGNYSVDGRYIDKSQRVEFNDKTKTKLLNKNDLVMVLNDKTKTGDIIGSTILIDEDNKYIYNQRSERIVCSEGTDVLFFWFLLNSTPVRADVFGRSQGGTQIYVNFGALKSIVLYLPPFEEQQKIATVLTNADKEIELLEQQLVDLQQEKKALMQVLLTGKKRVVVSGEEV